MDADIKTLLARIGQLELDYTSHSVPADREVAGRVPLFARMLATAPAASPSPCEQSPLGAAS